MTSEPLIRIQGLKRQFPAGRGRVLTAVNGVDLEIFRGEIFGLVGESGCGKSTLGRTIKGIYPANAGSIFFDGQDISRHDRQALRVYQRRMQMIFQDPYASLNPRMTVRELIGEGLEIHRLGTRAERRARIAEIMQSCGLNPEYADRFAHEFSGGQRQRIAIARALVMMPDFVICDEPVSALDVSIQGQIVNLLKRLQQRHGLTYLFIAHNLSMVKYIADRVGVMYLGRLVEVAPKAELFQNPKHPYTQALLASQPIPDPRRERQRQRTGLIPQGEPPSPLTQTEGCAFRERCPHTVAACASLPPRMTEAAANHFVLCTLPMAS